MGFSISLLFIISVLDQPQFKSALKFSDTTQTSEIATAAMVRASEDRAEHACMSVKCCVAV